MVATLSLSLVDNIARRTSWRRAALCWIHFHMYVGLVALGLASLHPIDLGRGLY